MPATPTQIKEFLSVFKRAAQLDLNVIPRERNLDFLTRHGFTPRERKEAILGLSVKDYCKGPEEDDKAGGPKDIWFFGIAYEGVDIYIKLQLVDEKDEETGDTMRHAKCISFHDAERRLQFPYKGL
jgi:hypothetical protein